MKDYRWLSQVYESVKPSTGNGRLIWHSLGPKTISLIHENIQVEDLDDDLETLVLDAELLETILGSTDPGKRVIEVEIKIARRLRNHQGDPRYKELGERLENLKEKHEQGVLISVDFLRELLELARDVVAVEQITPPMVKEDQGKSALTELFNEVRNSNTEVIVERIVSDIDEIVRVVRFEGWQDTHAGEREIKQAIRSTLFKYRLHQDKDLFSKTFSYIRQYY